MKKAVKIAVNVIAWVIVVISLAMTAMVFTAQSDTGVSNVFGYMPFSVQSDSMSPTFKKGDLIIGKEADFSALKVGDVITFKTMIENQPAINTHRIVEVNNENGVLGYVTKGDKYGNDKIDADRVFPGDVIAKYNGTKIPVLGSILDFLKTQTGFFVCIVLPLAVFFLWCLYQFIAAILAVKKPKISSADEEEIKRRAVEEYLAAQNNEEGDALAVSSQNAAEAGEETKSE